MVPKRNAVRPSYANMGVRVPISITVLRESEPSTDYMATIADAVSGSLLAIYTPYTPNPQYFLRQAIYIEALATAYEYSEPRLGMTRWPTLSDEAQDLLFNISEGSGGNQVSTVPATLDIAASVDGSLEQRLVAVLELMDDGQWRVAGYGDSTKAGLTTLDLKVTTSGTLFALGLDDYGISFVPGLAVAVSDRIRPTRFRGWVYDVTEAGALPAVEPEWWPVEGDNPPRLCGTARLQAVRYYRPLAHGPITVEMT